MILPDVNVLLHAHREDSPQHRVCARWLQAIIDDAAAFGMSELVLSGFVRIATHPKVFTDPSPLEDALTFAEHRFSRGPNAVSFGRIPGSALVSPSAVFLY